MRKVHERTNFQIVASVSICLLYMNCLLGGRVWQAVCMIYVRRRLYSCNLLIYNCCITRELELSTVLESQEGFIYLSPGFAASGSKLSLELVKK